MRKEQIAIIALAVWLILISLFMLLAQSINLEIFFVLSLIGFLIIVETIAPKYYSNPVTGGTSSIFLQQR